MNMNIPRRVLGIRWSIHAAVSAILLAVSGCITADLGMGPGLRTSAGKSFIIAHSEKPFGWGYWSHPWALRLDNAVVVTYCLAGDGGTEPKPEINIDREGPAFTTDGGASWVVGRTNMPDMSLSSVLQKGVINCRDGSMVFYRLTMGPAGKTAAWKPKDGPAGSFETGTVEMPWKGCDFIFPSFKGVEAPDGALLIVGYYHLPNTHKYATGLFESANRGKDWKLRSVVATPDDCIWGNEGPCEPAISITKDGRIISIMRTGSDLTGSGHEKSSAMLLAVSSDNGLTWTHRKMGYPGVMPKLVTLENGIVACAFGRPGNNVIFSHDEGLTWGNEISLTTTSDKTSGYCDLIEITPNRLLAVYDRIDSPLSKIWIWEPKYGSAIYGLLVDVSRR